MTLLPEARLAEIQSLADRADRERLAGRYVAPLMGPTELLELLAHIRAAEARERAAVEALRAILGQPSAAHRKRGWDVLDAFDATHAPPACATCGSTGRIIPDDPTMASRLVDCPACTGKEGGSR